MRECRRVLDLPGKMTLLCDKSEEVTAEKGGVENFMKSVFSSLVSKISHLESAFGGHVSGILTGN